MRDFLTNVHRVCAAPLLGRSVMLAAVFWLLQPVMARAQQREPAFEVYGLTGAYFHSYPSIARQWKPQFGGGVMAPLGRNWGALFDVTTSALEASWNHDGRPGTDPGSSFTRERRIVLMPSLVRLWRRDRFSIYAGGGLGFDHDRQHSRLRPIVGHDANGQPVLADDFQNTSSTGTDTTLLLRAGAIVSLTRTVVVRAGYSLLPGYIDEKPSMSFEFGVGYRF